MVYPRVCGGTKFRDAVSTSVYGLSPRVRGNLNEGQQHEQIDRSITACAGEPLYCNDSH